MTLTIYNTIMTQYNKNEIASKIVTLQKVLGLNNNNFDIQGLIEKYEIGLLMLENIVDKETVTIYLKSIEEEFKHIIKRIS